MPRIVISPESIQGDSVTITDPSELHHLVDVLRVNVGDRLECLDGAGNRYTGAIARCARRVLVVQIDERFSEPPRLLTITLAQSLIPPDRFEWVIQKATELGVDRIIPLLTSRTLARHFSPEASEKKLIRWRRIAKEAAAQCGRSRLTDIETPQALPSWLLSVSRKTRLLIPTLVGRTSPLKEELASLHDVAHLAVLIGPEGDFTPDEIALAKRHGAIPISLGHLTLRSETAAIATLAILQHVLS